MKYVKQNNIPGFIGIIILLIVFYVISIRYDFSFHTASLLMGILISVGIFMIAWNTYEFTTSSYLIFLGSAYLTVSFLDVVHIVTYSGAGKNFSLEFGSLILISRYYESIALILSVFMINKKFNKYKLLAIFTIVTIIITIANYFLPSSLFRYDSILPILLNRGIFIPLLFIVAIILIYKKKSLLDKTLIQCMIIALSLTIISETLFVAGTKIPVFSIIGHMLKIVSFYAVYRALIVTGLRNPFEGLYENLKHAEDSLQHGKEFIDHTLDSIHEIFIMIDYSKNITYFNKKAGEFFKRHANQVLEKNIFEGLPELKGTKIEESLTASLINKVFITSEIEYQNNDRKHWLNLTIYPDQDGCSIFLEPITENKEVKEKLQQVSEELMEKKGEIEDVVDNFTHDVRSPLTTINGFSKHLTRVIHSDIIPTIESLEISDEKKKEVLELFSESVGVPLDFICKSSIKVELFITGLIEYIKARYDSVQIRELDINNIISEILPLFTEKIESKNITITVEELPGCLGDYIQVSQVFTHIVENAIKYLDPKREGKVVITGKTNEDQSVYCIEDNGIGIDEKNFSDIYKPFKRLNSDRYEGQGLGLAFIKKILKNSNGQIHLESIKGEGSKFFITLPNIAFDKEK